MADESENPIKSMVEKISEKIHDHSSSYSDSEKKEKKPESPSLVKEKIYRLFGREKPVRGVLGGGKGKSGKQIEWLVVSRVLTDRTLL